LGPKLQIRVNIRGVDCSFPIKINRTKQQETP
jgi:hypothetical protein